MLSTTKARPNHYEILGLSPTATTAEIAKAFERAVSSFRPRPFGTTASASVAYATLRDPVKRRSYDASIGLQPKPEPKALAPTRLELKYRREWAPASFMAAPPAQDPPEPPRAAEPYVPSLPARASAEPALSIKEQVEELLARRTDEAESAPKQSLSEWTRPGLTIGALLLAAAAIGIFAGLKSVETIEPEQPARAATVGLPAAKPQAAKAVEPPAAQAAPAAGVAERRVATAKPVASVRRQAPAEALAPMPADSITESIQVVQSDAAGPPVESLATEQVARAALPIAKRDIARTIHKIGYSCGAVDSAVPVDGGGAGVFKVTCTSGATYRAAPIRGRYHFRKWDRR